MDETWTISELAEHAAAALAADGVPRVNGRVRDLPNERLIRWYTSIGLLDPPLGRRGRTALYGPRHLLQLLAVKRRQALGRSIAEIQVELAGAPDSLLRDIAADDGESDDPTQTEAFKEARPTTEAADATDTNGVRGVPRDTVEIDIARPRDAFWTVRPSARFHREPTPEASQVDEPTLVQGVRLAAGVTVIVETRHLSEDDLAAIAESAAPLLDTLRRRGLLEPVGGGDSPQRHSPGRHQ
ncbi:MerR family transcriptional regulator [Actinomadura harenae]|uniref:MerR family transcriptional regulator n=1 Tax=Actinomadura harenae TaxID=2483351 RepID=A0A3M2M6Z7_9ACTN|nr:MerR family transcriptional regulator [Actinomadura harenae]RMI45331.1 MerR family transcriptional regulator [Actinomadura harenae]